MTGVTYDDGSFLVDDQRIWLVSGSVHYFRTPAALWRDRLLKAKRAGLNCISTYLAWNFHEPVEGQWELSGDKDPAGFVRLADELGLYVILRPGPYIGGDWDFGGLPGWLAGKSGISFRSANAAYSHYFDKYIGQVLPPLAELQVTRGGNIVLIQSENEYVSLTMPDCQTHLAFINQLFRRSGFEIPIITCNNLTQPPAPDSIESTRGWDQVVQRLKELRVHQPHAPMLVAEFRCSPNDIWGREHQTADARVTARRAMEMLGYGAQYNYYVWHGGTNFGFWGSQLIGTDRSYQTTSYDCDAPVAEGGALTEKYYTTRVVNMLAKYMGRFFAGTYMEEPGVTVHNSTSVLNLAGPQGCWAVVTNNGVDAITRAGISLPDGRNLDVSLAPLGAAAVPMNLVLTEAAKL
ncbi:MAG: beta-galactosidase, partial [Phycisphaerae bacterium]|nr:beta-galactosidase [Phycisphaerae bacterium]